MKYLQLEGLKEKLNNNINVAIIGHRNPDGDAIGSTLGLKLYLDQKNINAQVIVPNNYPDFLKWLPANDLLIIMINSKNIAISY